MSRTSRSFVIACAAIVAAAGCSNSPASPSRSALPPPSTSASATGKRAPDPAPGRRLPLPDHFYVVALVAAQHPEALANACPERGGSWEFLDRVVAALRQEDSRWGYGGSSSAPGGASPDVVVYHFGAGPDEGSADVYAVEILVDRCGADPRPSWNAAAASTRTPFWTSRGRW